VTETTAAGARWQSCAIVEIVTRTPRIKNFFLRLAQPFNHIAGQHVDARLTAPDGYKAVCSYSIASAPNAGNVIELAIERLADGEVSPFFHEIARVGDTIEVRGPLGGHFLWPQRFVQPVILIGSGSGVVPLMAMIRHRKASSEPLPVAMLLSARTWGDILFRDELIETERSLADFALAFALTREPAARKKDFSRRIDAQMVAEVAARLPRPAGCVFVCGNAFVDIAADAAVAWGLEPAAVKTERYGA
jgi:glycine betaine catabolism B